MAPLKVRVRNGEHWTDVHRVVSSLTEARWMALALFIEGDGRMVRIVSGQKIVEEWGTTG